jgi:aldehyde:ferredoxin oxidoreductase
MAQDRLSRVLYIDLSRRRFWLEDRPELFQKNLGGSGVAIQLLSDELPPGVDPFSPENPIVLAVGPLTGLFPLASKTVAMFKSPHTLGLGESHCGGRSAVALRMAGYGAIVIKGASVTPVYLAIHDDGVYFRDASALWGVRSCFTVGRILREAEPGRGLRTIMRIGGAGERLITYASVVAETYRHFGRLGLGAVFGSKKLKALVISGKRSLPVTEAKLYRQVYDEIYRSSVSSPAMKKYHDLGTAENIVPLNKISGLPTRNLKETCFEQAATISGEALASGYLGRRLACAHCPVGCVHLAAVREAYEDEPWFYKTSFVCYDYEPIFSLGAMLGISEATSLLKLMEEAEIWGLDAMSLGVVLAWATEAREKGLLSAEDTAGLELKWGDAQGYIKAVRLIVQQANDFYRALGRGVDYASAKYGGQEFALAFAGNEMPGYHTGLAAVVGYITGSRHSHLDSAGYALDQKMLLSGKKESTEKIAQVLLEEERWRQILGSLVVCFFARGIYSPPVVLRALKVAGIDLAEDDLIRLGRKIHKAKFDLNVREGFSAEAVRIPKRILETPTPLGQLSEEEIRQAVRFFVSHAQGDADPKGE